MTGSWCSSHASGLCLWGGRAKFRTLVHERPPSSMYYQMAKISQRSPSQRQDPAPLNNQQATVLDTLCQTTSKTGTQPQPLAERLPKIIIRSQTPQNTPPDVYLPTRKTRSSLIHQKTGTSPLNQEAYTAHWTNLTHGGQTPKTMGTTNLQPAKRRPQTQQVKENEKTKKHTADEGARYKPTRPNKWRGNRQPPEKEFRIMIVKMIQNLGNRMEKIQEMFNKDLEELKSK